MKTMGRGRFLGIGEVRASSCDGAVKKTGAAPESADPRKREGIRGRKAIAALPVT